MTKSAQIRQVDPLWGKTRFNQLAAIGFRQVDLGSLARLSELNCHLRTYFKAAAPDSGADSGMQVLRPGSPPVGHGFERR